MFCGGAIITTRPGVEAMLRREGDRGRSEGMGQDRVERS